MDDQFCAHDALLGRLCDCSGPVIKIGVYLGTEPTAGGAFQYGQRFLETLAFLDKSAVEVVCVYTDQQWEAIVRDVGFRGISARYHYLHTLYDRLIRNTGFSPVWWRSLMARCSPLARTILEERCDLWIFPAQDSLSYQVPVVSVVTVFDLMHRYRPQFPEVGGWGRAWRRDVHYRHVRDASAAIVVETSLGRQQFVESYGADFKKIHVLQAPAPKVPADIGVAEEILPPDLPAKFFFYPAQFWQHKNHARLVRALALCHQEQPEMALVFAGSPKNAFESVRQVVKELGVSDRVRFLGYVPEAMMPHLYRAARAMLMPTFFGPSNIPPLEGFVLGCPVAVSRIFEMPEQLGDAALYFDPESESEMAEVMLRLWTDDALCAELVRRGTERLGDFSLAGRARQLAAVIDSVVAKGELGGVAPKLAVVEPRK